MNRGTQHSIWILLSALCAWLVPCYAQKWELAPIRTYWRVSPKPLGSINETKATREDDDTLLRGGAAWGARLTWNTPGYYGHEFGFVRAYGNLRSRIVVNEVKQTFESRIFVDTFFYNFLIYFMPRDERWRPYMTGGLQAHRYGDPGWEEWDRGSSRKWGVNYGAGIKLMPAKHFLIRLDVRDYIAGGPYDLQFKEETKFGTILRNQEFSVGIAFGF